MSMPAFTSAIDLLLGSGPAIPEIDTAEPRFPFVITVDISGSTGMAVNGQKDIDKINEAMGQLVQKLKHPPRNGPLAQVHDQIDILILAYASDASIVVDWTPASQLPDHLPVFVAGGGTAMGAALKLALDKVLARQRRYKEQGLPKCGMPHIFNITDGEPTDVKLGDALWQEVEDKLAKAASDPKKKSLVVRHFLAPNGYVSTSGSPTGADRIASWFGQPAVIALEDGSDNFQSLVEVVVKTITILSQPGANAEAALGAMKGGLKDAA